MAAAIEEVLARAGLPPDPSGAGVTCTTLKGGLSHRVIRVDTGGRRYVLRILDPAVSEAGLGVPLRQEIDNTVRAARAGVGPRVLAVVEDYADGRPALLLEFVDGRTLGRDDVRDPGMIPRVAAACRRLHAAPDPFGNRFSIFRKQDELVALCRRHGLRVPDGYADHLPVMAGIERAMDAAPLPLVPCHNDLLPENLIDEGAAVRIVDYQLSGMNDPAFELGNIAAEADFDPDRAAALAAAYFGADLTEALVARVRLYLLASNYTWTLWFSVHHGLLAADAADAEFDYWAEAADKWGQALRDLTDPGLGRLIDTVRAAR
ncbi:phosphotransferase [Actinomadura miaoliensis]|uniref:Phosphotransferase family protein n=1 Tax=Actinomadura miaoliensis TaxID=430685 RepID=A0ABP7W616_9ACTN